jgi:acetoin utilization deacetylase AcuC-like enzyme
METFRPQFILISAGFDAHEADPLGGLKLTIADYTKLTELVCDLAERHCGGRIVSVLEGGYNLTALGESVAAHMRTLADRAEKPKAK